MPNDPYRKANCEDEFGNLLPDVLTNIVKPKLARLVSDGNVSNKSSLHAAFEKETESTVSFSTFNMWLEVLGISFRKTVQIDGLAQVPAPGGAGVAPARMQGTKR
jgi:hypothetical protein